VGHLARRLLGITILILNLSACGGGSTKSETVNTVSEPAYCSTSFPTSNPITITGLARYYYRATGVSVGLTGDPIARGIAVAEVVVTDAAGTVIQCSQTDASGNINLQINKTAGTYTITVKSRAYNSKLKASVLSDPTNNAPYSISTNFSLTGLESGSKSVGTFYAYARIAQSSNLEGGAFHILYNLYLANEYIRTQTNNSSFVADKVQAYWKQGFNPGSYVGVSSGLSFYLQGERELYILGGSNGNTKTADTDHFDDSVIIHEYGHFLEDVYGKSASPGGSHNGNFIIDPRLAWSEGWANFLQGAVVTVGDSTRGHYYIDTYGYSADSSETGESGGLAIRFDLTESGVGATYDRVTVAGEGTFREISVSRTLYKVISTTAIPFSSIWTAFSDTTNGMRSPANVFSNVGIFNKYLNLLVSGGDQSSWNTILSNEMQNKTTADYADPVTAQATICSPQYRTLTPVVDATAVVSTSPMVTEPRSNLLRSNDFYLFQYGGGGGTLSLNYTQVSGVAIDLDLYLYKSGYVYQEDYSESIGKTTGGVALKSDRSLVLDGGATAGLESFSLAGLSAGYYLINVKANTFGKNSAQVNGTAQYTLSYQGSYLCPEN
jgi:hypothetical protein